MLEETRRQIEKLRASAWLDAELREKLVTNPRKCLQDAGIILGSLVVVVVTCAGQAEAIPIEEKLGRELRAGEEICEILISPEPPSLKDGNVNDGMFSQRTTGSCC